MSIHIPQISVNQRGELVPNPGENIISLYKPVEHDKHEGELYVTSSRIVWVGTKAKGSFLGKVAKAAVLVAAIGGAAAMASSGSSRGGIGPVIGGIGGMRMGMGIGGLGMSHMVSKNQQGQPQTVSLPYEVVNDVRLEIDLKTIVISTQAGPVAFNFARGGDANSVLAALKGHKVEGQKGPSAQPMEYQKQPDYRQAPPPEYVPPPPSSEGYHYCPHCGTPIEPSSLYCHNCGGRIR